jgi:hypothetical protein
MAGGLLARCVDFFRGHGARLNAYEMAIIEAVARRLDTVGANRIRRRTRAINRVQRLLGGQDITLYQMRGGRPSFPADTAIVDQDGSVRFARAVVRSGDPMSRLRATIYLHDGNLSAVEFDRPSKFASADHIDEIQVTMLGPPFIDIDALEERTGWPAKDR